MSDSYTVSLQEASEYYRVDLRRHTQDKATGPCPKCGGEDRFVVWLFEGSGTCMKCRYSGFFRDLDENDKTRGEHQIEKQQRQARARLDMASCEDWIAYRMDMDTVVSLWSEQGITRDEIDKWGLGVCDSCPLAPEYQSLSIPIFHNQMLVDIRHRLLVTPEQLKSVGKYRSHLAGLVPFPLNLDAVNNSANLHVFFGEKKAIKFHSHGWYGSIGLGGTKLLDDLIMALRSAHRGTVVTFCPDPGEGQDARNAAKQIAKIGVESRVADFFLKPDDLLATYGVDVVKSIFEQSRRLT